MKSLILVYVATLLASLPFFWYQVVASPYLSAVDPTRLSQSPKHNGILCLVEMAGCVILAGFIWLIAGVLLGLDLDLIFTPLWLTVFSVVQLIVCTKLRSLLMRYHIEYLDTLPRPPHKRTAVVDYDSFLVIHNCFYLIVLSIALSLL